MTDDPQSLAHEHLTAELAPRHGTPLAKAWRFSVALLGGLLGGGIETPNLDLVVRRKTSGLEVMRTAADLGDPELLLDQVQRDLETKTVTEFISEWRIIEP